MGTGDVVLVILALAGQTSSATTLDLFLPTSGDRPFYRAMVERRDGPSWLRNDDDDDDFCASDLVKEYSLRTTTKIITYGTIQQMGSNSNSKVCTG